MFEIVLVIFAGCCDKSGAGGGAFVLVKCIPLAFGVILVDNNTNFAYGSIEVVDDGVDVAVVIDGDIDENDDASTIGIVRKAVFVVNLNKLGPPPFTTKTKVRN